MNTFNPTIVRMVKIVAPIAAVGVTFAMVATPSMAQDIHDRLHRQDARISEGVRDHELNRYEAHDLDARDRQIQHVEVIDRRRDDGRLTGLERARLDERLNCESRVIYDRRHDIR